MSAATEGGFSNPDDVTIHRQVKEIADMLSPELIRLYESPLESTGDVELYRRCIEQIKLVKREVTNHDALFAFRNAISHMRKAIDLARAGGINRRVLWSLQEVTAILFKMQSLPS